MVWLYECYHLNGDDQHNHTRSQVIVSIFLFYWKLFYVLSPIS